MQSPFTYMYHEYRIWTKIQYFIDLFKKNIYIYTKSNGCLQLCETLAYEKNLEAFSSDISAQYVQLEIKY